MSRGSFSQDSGLIFSCPACGRPVSGTAVYEIKGQVVPYDSAANIKIVGLRVDHNCIPPVTRSGEGHGTQVRPE